MLLPCATMALLPHAPPLAVPPSAHLTPPEEKVLRDPFGVPNVATSGNFAVWWGDDGFTDPTNLAIIEQYTGVPADLIAASVPPVYAVDGIINAEGLLKLQSFFRERDFLQYDDDLDPNTFIDQQYVMWAMAELNPNQP